MSHADEFIALAYENHWRVTEEPVEILYTEYSMSKGQPLLNGVNIIFDGWLRWGCRDELDSGASDCVGPGAAGLPAALTPQRAVQGVGEGRLRAVRDRGIYAILRPDDTTVVANWLGVDRGTDLMEHVLIIAFVFHDAARPTCGSKTSS
mgnify:CR=1 FL=1